MKNILLLQPRIGDMDWMRSSPALPLGILQAAALISREYQVNIIDQRVERNWKRRIREKINADTLFVGVTSFTGPMILDALRMCDYVKEISPLPIVWGGVHPTLLPENTLADRRVDIVVKGEGEETLLELAQALTDGGPPEKIRGLSYKDNGKIKSNEARELLDLDKIPAVPYDLVDVNSYMPLYLGQKSFYFQASRGCPYSCAYCYNPIFNRKNWRKLSSENVIERLANVTNKYRIENIYFVDDNFFLDLEWCREIILGIRKLNVTWQVQGVDVLSIKNMDEEFLDLLSSSNCLRITIGIESGSPKIRKLIRKTGGISDITEQIARVNRKNINIFCSFMAGFPFEEKEDLQMTIDLILRLNKTNPRFINSPIYSFTPYPGTEMFHLAIKEGYQPPTSLEKWGHESGWNKTLKWKNVNPKDQVDNLKISFLSYFLDSKTSTYNAPKIIRFLARFYGPIARFRLQHLFLGFLFEEKAAALVKYLWSKIKNR